MAGNRVESAGRANLRTLPLVAALRHDYQQWWHLMMLFPIRPQRTRQGFAHHCVVGLRISLALQGRDSRDLHQTILSDPDEVLSSLIAGSGTTFRGPNSGPCGSHCGRAMVFPSQRMPGKRPEKWPESRGWPQAQTLRSPGAPSTLPRVNVMASLYGRETLRLPA